MKKKTKIIATVTNDLSYDQRMIRICTSLTQAGYEVQLVGRKRANSKSLTPQSFQQKRLSCHFDKGKLFYLEYNIRLFLFLLFARFDIVNSIDLDTILPGFFISKLKGKTCVYDAHEYFTEVPEVVMRPKIQRFWKGVERLTVPRLKYCYTVGGSLAEMFTKEYKIPFAVVRNVPFKIKTPIKIASNAKKILLYQGALNEGRGLEHLIEAMQEIRGAELQLAGEGDLSQVLRDLVKEKDLENKVTFLGFVLPKDLPTVTARADVGLNLLENKGLSYYYSLANKAFDYIQGRKPSINMAFPEYQRINEEYGTFCLINDLKTDTIATALKRLLTDEKYYLSLVEKCDVAADVFIWEREEEVLLNVYKSVGNGVR
ncbi:MAG: glycosyltransferase involved in cell wall biosynthesis [Saprospiraceae bacterium]